MKKSFQRNKRLKIKSVVPVNDGPFLKQQMKYLGVAILSCNVKASQPIGICLIDNTGTLMTFKQSPTGIVSAVSTKKAELHPARKRAYELFSLLLLQFNSCVFCL